MRLDESGALQLGGTSNAGFIDFDSSSIQLNTQRNPNTGAFVNTGRAHAGFQLFDGAGTASNSYVRFLTSSSNNTTASERMRIDSNGNVLIGKTSTGAGTSGLQFEPTGTGVFSRDSDVCIIANRQTNDGRVIEIRQSDTLEGSIDVSGSTVSLAGFSGTHESSGISKDTSMGTVVSTIDELDIYVSGSKSGQTRANHAKVKVSDTVGDSAVYGVVSRFDDNDKVFVASVGIGSVRVTGACAKGDLLESNGDGTAKVQSDDIVRSKTIGKVTIGNSNTGVKLVSCVLYCG
tara:strand:- start:45 stop:914 length:870 start_codon:yes stop_codon:yes gene_type:complete